MRIFFYLLFLILNLKVCYASKPLILDGFWFECEFSHKTNPPTDKCEMLDDDGFYFKNNKVIHIKNISTNEKKCKKNKEKQCFKSTDTSIKVSLGRSDKVKFIDSSLILTFLGCSQNYQLYDKKFYVEAIPDKEKCFWTGKKHFYLKKYDGSVNIKE